MVRRRFECFVRYSCKKSIHVCLLVVQPRADVNSDVNASQRSCSLWLVLREGYPPDLMTLTKAVPSNPNAGLKQSTRRTSPPALCTLSKLKGHQTKLKLVVILDTIKKTNDVPKPRICILARLVAIENLRIHSLKPCYHNVHPLYKGRQNFNLLLLIMSTMSTTRSTTPIIILSLRLMKLPLPIALRIGGIYEGTKQDKATENRYNIDITTICCT
ncbi:hypothetical protein F511_18016 [Dorcoceras hygrometricum]|uniref:Uncharacterized protein n=1 Tax=Dorcoceras hygrometricum TaxID=472368 RepID=A0A2Z7APS2_9LAMI|nr:hypothetical protein F511_18016 [Dorcoceras hygrometricum]